VRDDPDARFTGEQLLLREALAIDRASLANERALLASVGAALALLIAGAALVHPFPLHAMQIIGWPPIPDGATVLAVSLVGHSRVQRAWGRMDTADQANSAPPPAEHPPRRVG
jgi:uncharacterized membrane protein YidH (DUF202 family)